MKKNLVISSVAAIAALNPEGFTVNAATIKRCIVSFHPNYYRILRYLQP